MTEVAAQTKKFQKELNSGTSSLVLLSVLSRSKDALYGYQIAKMLEESGPDLPMMKQGTLYPVLRSLEENGLLESIVEQGREHGGLQHDVAAGGRDGQRTGVAAPQRDGLGQHLAGLGQTIGQQFGASQVVGCEAHSQQLEQVAARATTDFEHAQPRQV